MSIQSSYSSYQFFEVANKQSVACLRMGLSTHNHSKLRSEGARLNRTKSRARGSLGRGFRQSLILAAVVSVQTGRTKV